MLQLVAAVLVVGAACLDKSKGNAQLGLMRVVMAAAPKSFLRNFFISLFRFVFFRIFC